MGQAKSDAWYIPGIYLVRTYSSIFGDNLNMSFVTEHSIMKSGAIYTDPRYLVRDSVRRLSCLLGSAGGTTRSISVHAEGERSDLQQYARSITLSAFLVR